MRKKYLDNLKSSVVILVVLYHVIMMFTPIIPLSVGSFKAVQYQDAYMYLVYPWFMVILFVVSGMTSRFYLERHTVLEFRKSRTVKLLVPSTLSLFVFHWITGYFSMSAAGAFGSIPSEIPGVVKYFIMALSGSSVLWYIQMLWIFSMVLSFLHKWEKGKLYELCGKMSFPMIAALAVPLWLFGQILNTPVITVYRFGLYGFSFFVGYFVFANDEVMEKVSERWIFTSIAAGVMGVAYTVFYFGRDFVDAPVNRSVFTMLFTWTAVLAVLGAMKKFSDKETAFFKFANKRSFGLYVFHYLPTVVTAYYIFPANVPVALKYVIVAVAAFAGGYALFELFGRLPFFRWVLLGISDGKNFTVE